MITGLLNMERLQMKYEIRQLSWSKRRKHTESPKALSVELVGFKKEINHTCLMVVDYEEEKVELKGRVTYNEIQDYWIVSGINSKGNQCIIKILE